MKDKNLEKIAIESLKTFCVDNADKILKCWWIDTPYCMKSCKFYREYVRQENGTEEEDYNVHP